jgi:chromosome segregation protein
LLKLKKVEIQGFKSFVDRTEMRFNGAGIAAIVGPNGCGKSNLSDAISWVLGEQSAKSLRGSRMEDVIFAGTRDRKPVGMASVTMTLVDPNYAAEMIEKAKAAAEQEILVLDAAVTAAGAADESKAPAAEGSTSEEAAAAAPEAPPETSPEKHNPLNGYSNGHNGHANGHSNGHANGHSNGHAGGVNGGTGNRHGKDILFAANGEITITRRLYRSGESEYLINGRTARLRDIQDLFMGSGLGPESYAIIEQGRIGQILSNKPQDRRAIIEEAAGITKFKTKKRLAEAKLEGAKQNLSRVFDILEEVSRQVNSLKRQAAKAKRHEELRTEMLGFLRTAVAGRYRILEREATKLALDLNLASNEYQEFSTQVTEKETVVTAVKQQFFETEQLLTAERAKLSEAKLEAERTRSKLELQSRQVSTIDERLTVGNSESNQISQRLQQLQLDAAAQRDSLAELNQITDAARNRMTTKSQERDVLQRNVRDRESSIESTRQSVLRLLGETSTLKNQLAQVEEYLSSVERDMNRLNADEQSASADLERLETVRTELSDRMSSRQMELQSVTEQRKSVETELSQRRLAAQESRRKLEQLRSELSRQKARRDSLEEVISHRAYTTESVKRLFKAIEQGKVQGLKPAGVLADFVEVTDHAYEKAMEVFLHEELEYVVVKNWTEAEQGVELMRTGVDGRATFLVEPDESMSFGPGRTQENSPSNQRLSDILRFTNGLTQAPPQILPRLSNCFLVDDRESARQLAVQYPDSYFLTPDGISYHGVAVSGGKKTGSGPLALKRELRELNEFVNHRQKEVNETGTQLEAIEFDIQRLGEELERLRQAQQTQEKDALVLDQEFRKLKDEHHRASQKLSVARLELERLRKEQQRAAEVRERNTKSVAEKEEARTAQEQALEAARLDVTEMQAQFTKVTEEHAQLRAELAGLEERRRGEQSAQARTENQVRDLSGRINTLAGELQRLAENRTALLANNTELDARAKELAADIEGRTKVTTELAEREETLRTQLTTAEESLKQLRGEAQSSQEKRSSTEIELVRRQADLKYLEETARKELNASPAELTENDDTEVAEEVLVEAEAKYQETKGRIEAMGAVNPQALEEFQEAQQRYDFLNAQRQDLLDSIRDTEKAIAEIDVESRKRFSEAFEIINVNFRKMFSTLFGGGTGEMRLTDESNVSESGIDIVASPPGKKLQSVLLLSGGEKSLTAMALLMAIFQYQPSPFCVLDEVDAPLDEPNTVRLTTLLKEMAAQTQFVVITHAKRTMEAAQALYGVTMQEPGVSKLVSVRFQPPPQQAELMLQANA